jgi:hypothetical protein
MRKTIAALLLALFIAPAAAQTCSPVPALPDTERRTQYSITASTGPLNVGFALYGDSTDFVDWIQVFVNGTSTTAYTLTSASGSVATLCRPISDARITFTVAQTGTVQIVGARRPRRTSQFTENRGVAARDINQVVSDLVAQNRETWDWRSRVIQGVPGDNFGVLSPATVRANTLFGFDANGNITYLPLGPTISVTAGSTFNTRGLAAAASISGTVQFVQTAGYTSAGDGGGATYTRTGGATSCGFQSADGAWWKISGPVLWAAACGAACDSLTDDSSAFQNLISTAASLKLPARFAGSCALLSSGLTIPSGIDFGGVDPFTSRLLPAPAINAISWAVIDGVKLHDFFVSYPGAATGTGLTCDGTSSAAADANVRSTISNVRIEVANIGMMIKNCVQITVENSYFNSNLSQNLVISNTADCDSGDNGFFNNTFIMAAAQSSVLVYCGGGQRFVGNKFNNAPSAIAVQYALGSGLTNSNSTAHLFSGNSIENSDICLLFQRSAGTGLLLNVNITGNEMVCRIGVDVQVSGVTPWLYNMGINGNTWFGTGGASNVFLLADGVLSLSAGANQLFATGAGTIAASMGAQITSGSTLGPFAKGVLAPGAYAASTAGAATTVTCSATCY